MPVQFGDLPETKGPRPAGAWKEEAEQLRARPGEWALVTTKPSQVTARNHAAAIKHGVLQVFRPPGHFEAVSRGTDVWARYVGDGGEF